MNSMPEANGVDAAYTPLELWAGGLARDVRNLAPGIGFSAVIDVHDSAGCRVASGAIDPEGSAEGVRMRVRLLVAGTWLLVHVGTGSAGSSGRDTWRGILRRWRNALPVSAPDGEGPKRTGQVLDGLGWHRTSVSILVARILTGDVAPGRLLVFHRGGLRSQPADAQDLRRICQPPDPQDWPKGLERVSSVHGLLEEEEALTNFRCGLLAESYGVRWDHPVNAVVYGSSSVGDTGWRHSVTWGGHTNSVRGSRLVAMLEGLERQGPSNGDRQVDVLRSTWADLSRESATGGPLVVDPAELGLYDARFEALHPTAMRYRPDAPLLWARSRCLTSGSPSWVPLSSVAYDAVPLEERFVQETSNGCSTGSVRPEADLHGLFELIERDAFLLAWGAGRALSRLTLDADTPQDLRFTCARLDHLGFTVTLLDATSDLGIPVVIAVAIDRSRRVGGCVGAGCSLDVYDAARGALAEIASDAPTMGERLERRRDEVVALAQHPQNVRTLSDHADLFSLPEVASRHLGFLISSPVETSLSEFRGKDFAREVMAGQVTDHLRRICDLLATRGFAVHSTELTTAAQAALGLVSTAVTVPGLLPIDFGAERQRFREMPRMKEHLARLGIPAANDVPHPFP